MVGNVKWISSSGCSPGVGDCQAVQLPCVKFVELCVLPNALFCCGGKGCSWFLYWKAGQRYDLYLEEAEIFDGSRAAPSRPGPKK